MIGNSEPLNSFHEDQDINLLLISWDEICTVGTIRNSLDYASQTNSVKKIFLTNSVSVFCRIKFSIDKTVMKQDKTI